jgi:hypothetical protein
MSCSKNLICAYIRSQLNSNGSRSSLMNRRPITKTKQLMCEFKQADNNM